MTCMGAQAYPERDVATLRNASDNAEEEVQILSRQYVLKQQEARARDARAQKALLDAQLALNESKANLLKTKVKANNMSHAVIQSRVQAKMDRVQEKADVQKVQQLGVYIDRLTAQKESTARIADDDIAELRKKGALRTGSESALEAKIRVRKERALRDVTAIEDELQRVRGEKAQLQSFFKEINSRNEGISKDSAAMDAREQEGAGQAREDAKKARQAVDQAADLVRHDKAAVEALESEVDGRARSIREQDQVEEKKILGFRSKQQLKDDKSRHEQAEIEREDTLASLRHLEQVKNASHVSPLLSMCCSAT